MRLKLSMLACTALTAAALVSPALAKKAETVTMTREQYEAIMGRLEKLEKQNASAPAGSNAALEQRVQDLEISQGSKINALQQRADAVQLSFDNARPVITTGDGRFSLAVRGRFHFDAGTYSQSPGNDVPYVVDGQNVRDLGSGRISAVPSSVSKASSSAISTTKCASTSAAPRLKTPARSTSCASPTTRRPRSA